MIALAEGVPVGRYVLTSKLASGGMAEVWLARATGPGGFSKTVVLKTILPHLADNPDFVHMFLDEATLAAALDHPNIVHIFDLGELDSGYFIAMEHIAGKTLRQIKRQLRKSRQVPPTWLTLHVCAAVCDALHYAHCKTDEAGRLLHLVHRDVTSDNIMVSFAGETKVVDFGIAKARTSATITRAGMLKGKHSYMAPEQITARQRGVIPDRRVDVYALGVVLYEMLTGTRPFRADNDLALLRRIIDPEAPPVPPSQLASWITPPLEAIVLRAMAKDPRERFQTAAELRIALERYLAAHGLHPTSRHVATQLASIFPEEAPRHVLDSVRPRRPPSGTVLAKAPPKPLRTVSGTRPAAPWGPSPLPANISRQPPPLPVAEASPPDLAASPSAQRAAAPRHAEPDATLRTQTSARRSGPKPPTVTRAAAKRKPVTPGAAFERAFRERLEQTQASSLPPGVWDRLTQLVRADDPDGTPPREDSTPGPVDSIEPGDDARSCFERGLELFRQRDFSGALAALERAAQLDPDNRVYRSNIRLVRGRIDELD